MRIQMGMTARIKLWKKVPIPVVKELNGRWNPDWTTVDDGFQEITFDVEVNEQALREQAVKASKNKSGKSRDGAVEVIVTGTRRV